jgi:uncharacterized protein YecT (DUF1311 family)
MIHRYLIVILFQLAAIAIIMEPVQAIKCNPAGNQQELNACAGDDYRKADLELNKVYNALLKEEKKDALFIAKLRESQKAWLKFRDVELEAAFSCAESPSVCWGSMYPMCYNYFKAGLTKDRTARLKKYLTEGRPADGCH